MHYKSDHASLTGTETTIVERALRLYWVRPDELLKFYPMNAYVTSVLLCLFLFFCVYCSSICLFVNMMFFLSGVNNILLGHIRWMKRWTLGTNGRYRVMSWYVPCLSVCLCVCVSVCSFCVSVSIGWFALISFRVFAIWLPSLFRANGLTECIATGAAGGGNFTNGPVRRFISC